MTQHKILLSWSLIAGGSCFFFSGLREYYTSRLSQKQAEASWKSASIREAFDVDGRIVPPGSEPRGIIPAGEAFARLSIPRLHAVLYVVEGTDDVDLRRGPGHLEGSAPPGSNGNCVIAGHRDTHFRLLKDVRQGDEIKIQTAAGGFTYRVSGISVVSPGDTASLRPTGQPVLNLITCYPLHYVGAAPQRYVVHAGMVMNRASRKDFSSAP